MLHFLLSVGSSGFDPNNPTTWVTGGVAGTLGVAIFLAFSKGWVVAGMTHNSMVSFLKGENSDLKDQLKEERNKNESLHELIEGKTSDTLNQTAGAMNGMMEYLKHQQALELARAELRRASDHQ